MELSFGEQIKILLNRKHMTIKDLADLYTQSTGQPMSRQNLTQRLKRDNFPEQDMYTIAGHSRIPGFHTTGACRPASRPNMHGRRQPENCRLIWHSLLSFRIWRMKLILQYLQCPRLHPLRFLKRIQIRILLVLMT